MHDVGLQILIGAETLLVQLIKVITLKNLGCRARLLLLLLPVAGSAPEAVAQASHTKNVDGVDITISIDRTQVTVGEPLTMTIAFKNTSPSPVVDFSTNFQLSEGNKLAVMVHPPNDLEYRYTGAMPMGSYSDVPFKLVGGLAIMEDIMLLYDETQRDGFIFSRPGTYYIDASLQFRVRNAPATSSVNMPPVRVDVAPASGAAAEVFELLNEPELAKALHLGTPTTGTLDQFQQAADRYPGTQLGALAMRAVGRFYTHSGRTEDRARGALILQDYLARGMVPVDPDTTARDIAIAWHLNQEYETARQWIIYLVRNYPNSGHIREEDALVYYYFLQPAEFARKVPWYLLERPWVVPGVKPPTDLSPRKVE